MTGRAWDREYSSHPEFCQDAHGQSVTGVHAAGSSGCVLLEAALAAGYWSNAPTPDLTIAWLASTPVVSLFDLGAGKFYGRHRTGDAVLFPPEAGTFVQLEDAHVMRALSVPYRRLLALTAYNERGLPLDGDFGQLHGGLLRDSALLCLVEAAWREASAGAPHGALYTDGLLLQAAAVLLRIAQTPVREAARGGLAPWQLKRVTEFLDERLAEGVGLNELSGLVDLSAAYFCRAFKQSTGLPPHAWLIARRVERARYLLETTGLGIEEIAAQVGYAEPSHLARTFRRAHGLSPTQYRRRHRI